MTLMYTHDNDTHFLRRWCRHVCAIAVLTLLTACKNGETNSKYCSLPARFTMQNTMQAPALHTACNNMGEFCTITVSKDGKYFVCQGSAKEASQVPIVAETSYSGFYLGLSGLIVGLPNIPEMGMDTPAVVCFDLACPNCYERYYITKPLTIKESGYALCNSCNRTYNLNDCGIVSDGETGRQLYRYLASYISTTLVVNNR